MKEKILYVEDDINLGFVTQDNLVAQGFEVVHCEDGEKAIAAFEAQPFDLCVLDIMLPKMDGFSLAEAIREKDEDIPIIFLSAKSMKEDRIKGLKIGADDYLTKPFSIEELVLKIEIFLKRSSKKVAEEKEVFELGSYHFDHANLQLNYGEENYRLTQKEADILHYFLIHKNEIVKRDDVLKHVWGDDDYYTGRSMDVFITKLRKYLSQDDRIKIENIHGVGFMLKVHD